MQPLSTNLGVQCPIFGDHICQPLIQNTLPVSMDGYHGNNLQVHLHILYNEDHQEPMDGPLAAVINGHIPHFHPQLLSVEGHWNCFQ